MLQRALRQPFRRLAGFRVARLAEAREAQRRIESPLLRAPQREVRRALVLEVVQVRARPHVGERRTGIRGAPQRQQVRAAKSWTESDRLRDEIAKFGWIVKDTKDGPKLTRG